MVDFQYPICRHDVSRYSFCDLRLRRCARPIAGCTIRHSGMLLSGRHFHYIIVIKV